MIQDKVKRILEDWDGFNCMECAYRIHEAYMDMVMEVDCNYIGKMTLRELMK